MVDIAMGKLASGDAHTARSALFYLACTQNADGGWSQNMWLDGTPHWSSIQMDAIALPILLADKMRRENALDGYNPRGSFTAPCAFFSAMARSPSRIDGRPRPATLRTPWLPRLPRCSQPQTSPARVRWTDGRYNGEAATTDSGLGLHYTTLSTRDLPPGSTLQVTLTVEQNDDEKTQIPATFTTRIKS
jgi:hypothetical protein